jgi:hypothetical protein
METSTLVTGSMTRKPEEVSSRALVVIVTRADVQQNRGTVSLLDRDLLLVDRTM